ncbi:MULTISPECIES: hypothetical protein [unclassified Streptomyces]|nr:hypothetical protein [Streptomyces sp. NBC_00385]WRZ03575.1 hypothetical protein OG959_09570 [Streptomyces sp. NBC_00385]
MLALRETSLERAAGLLLLLLLLLLLGDDGAGAADARGVAACSLTLKR